MPVHHKTKEIDFKIKSNATFRKYFFYPLLLLIAVSFISCSSPESAPAVKAAATKPEPISTVEPVPMPSPIIAAIPADVALKTPIRPTESFYDMSYQKHMHTQETATTENIQSKDLKQNKFDEYRVVLAANKQMKIPGLPGELRVWIGNPNYQPSLPDDMTEANTTLPAVGEWAKIEPHAPAFKLEPAETPCIKIHPSGSEVRFNLMPQKSGIFKVGATVYLFSSSNCSDAPIPKIATDLYVTVHVDKKIIVQEKGKELWTIFWEQLLEFWEALLIILFGLILFLIRGKLKQWFGYEKN